MVRRINLALQGGGAHGAFTWGVLDRLLDRDDIEIAAISGTSAGAMNGAAFKAGMVAGGREGARQALDRLWERMGAMADPFLLRWMEFIAPGPSVIAKSIQGSLGYSLAETVSRVVSPYNYGPFYRNPLRGIVECFDLDAVRSAEGPAFFVSATNVRTGKIRVFSGGDVDENVLLASACLPTMFQAVEIPDTETGRVEAYWDGGYSGNPALFPLFDPKLPDDVVIVNINPLVRDAVPTSAPDIMNRINEISFNSSLLRELRAIHFVHRLLDEGVIAKGRMKRVLVHMISDDRIMTELNVATKMVPTAYLLAALKEAGQAAADRFADECGPSLGEAATISLPDMFG